VAREANVSIARLSEWRERALAGAATALKERERDDRFAGSQCSVAAITGIVRIRLVPATSDWRLEMISSATRLGRHSLEPEPDQRPREKQGFVRCRKEQTISTRALPSPGPAHALQERGNRTRRIDLDHSVEIANIQTELQGARGNNDAIVAAREGRLGLPALLLAQRAMRDEGASSQSPELDRELLHLASGIREDEPLFAPMEPRQHVSRVFQAFDVIELDVGVNIWRCAGPDQRLSRRLIPR
jgi:hypothetical protein